MPAAVTAIVLQLVQLGLQVAPQIIAAAQTEIALINSGTAPTAEQQAAIDAALDAAHAALQAGRPPPFGIEAARASTVNPSFDAALAFTFRWEGGFTNDPRDPGGATNYGITIETLSAWRNRTCSAADVQALTRGEAAAIYRKWYWDAVRGDVLPNGADLMVFDHGVTAGPGRSVRLLQGVVNAEMDGVIGPATLAAAAALDRTTLVANLASAQEVAYRATANFDIYGSGWLNRLAARKTAATTLIG